MSATAKTIHQTAAGQSVQLADDLYLFRVPKHQYRYGQSYALVVNDELILIDAVHEVTKEAVDALRQQYPRVAGLILTHSDLIDQAYTSIAGLRQWLDAPVYAHPEDHKGHPLEDLTRASGSFPQAYSLSIHHVPGHTPGSIMIYDHRHRRLFTGDSAVGHPYGQEGTAFTHPPIPDADWTPFVTAWQTFHHPVREVYPLHGQPDFQLADLEQLRDRMMEPTNVMQR